MGLLSNLTNLHIQVKRNHSKLLIHGKKDLSNKGITVVPIMVEYL